MLYIVATPIGNLEDISFRAVRILKEVDLIAAEDTRHSRKLLSHYDINTKLISFYEHNKLKRLPYLINELKSGRDIALISDAGTPGISDPGFSIISTAYENDIEVTMIPGPCALIMGMVLSNMPVHKFIFLGFLPPKKGKKSKILESVKDFEGSVILYESPYKIIKTLELVYDIIGNIHISLARELTKKFEQVLTKTASEWLEFYKTHNPKGEYVMIFNLFEKKI